jgi:hypothetical protein
MKPLLKLGMLQALGTTAYISLVAYFFFFMNTHQIEDGKTVFIPIFMLMLLVLSASITGTLVFGRSVLWYIDGKKKEAVSLLAYTLGSFFCLFLVVGLALFLSR